MRKQENIPLANSGMATFVARWLKGAKEIEKVERKLADMKQAQLELVRSILPEALDNAETTQVRLRNGTLITLHEEAIVSIPEAEREAAHKWLVKNGHSDIVQSNLIIDERDLDSGTQMHIKQLLVDLGATYKEDQKIHPQTLRAWGREMVKDGKKLPKCFAIFNLREARIKLKAKEQ